MSHSDPPDPQSSGLKPGSPFAPIFVGLGIALLLLTLMSVMGEFYACYNRMAFDNRRERRVEELRQQYQAVDLLCDALKRENGNLSLALDRLTPGQRQQVDRHLVILSQPATFDQVPSIIALTRIRHPTADECMAVQLTGQSESIRLFAAQINALNLRQPTSP